MFLNVYCDSQTAPWLLRQATRNTHANSKRCTLHCTFSICTWLDLWNPIKDQRVHNRSEGWLTAIHMRFNRFDMIWKSWFVNNNCYWSIMPVKCKFRDLAIAKRLSVAAFSEAMLLQFLGLLLIIILFCILAFAFSLVLCFVLTLHFVTFVKFHGIWKNLYKNVVLTVMRIFCAYVFVNTALLPYISALSFLLNDHYTAVCCRIWRYFICYNGRVQYLPLYSNQSKAEKSSDALHVAAVKGYTEFIQLALDRGFAKLLEYRNEREQLPVHAALECEQYGSDAASDEWLVSIHAVLIYTAIVSVNNKLIRGDSVGSVYIWWCSSVWQWFKEFN